MILQLALVPLIFAAQNTSTSTDIRHLVSPDSWGALVIADVPALRGAIAANTWFTAFADPDGLLALAETDEGARDLVLALRAWTAATVDAEAEALMSEASRNHLRLARAIDGGAAMWFRMDPVEAEPVFAFVARTGVASQSVGAQLSLLISEDLGRAPSTEQIAGSSVFAWNAAQSFDDAGYVVVGTEHVGVVIGTGTGVRAELEALAGRISAPTRAGGLESNPRYALQKVAMRTPGQVDGFLDLTPMMAMANAAIDDPLGSKAFQRSGVAKMSWIGTRMGVGQGEQLDFEMIIDVPPGTILARALDFMRPLPMGLLARVPADAASVSAMNYDLAGLVGLVFELADEFQEGGRDMVQGLLDMGSGMMGVDLRDDVINLVTGEMVNFWRGSPTAAASPESWYSNQMGFLIGTHDSELLLDSAEIMLESMPLATMAAPESVGGGLLRRIEIAEGDADITPYVATAPNFVAIAGDPALAKRLIDPDQNQGQGILGSNLIGGRLREFATSSYVQVSETARALQSFASLFDMVSALDEDLAYGEAQSKLMDIAARFSGTSVRTMERLPGALRIFQGAQ